ncbi:MAG: hypothetical protein JW795_16310 [Chitinivibrionales bacterium]|nr:hypothetical protein [Chitinivibrionales bacterium]
MIQQIPYAKAMSGSCELPGSPDLFLVSLFLSYATGRQTLITGMSHSPLIETYVSLFTATGHLSCEPSETGLLVTPSAQTSKCDALPASESAFTLPDIAAIPYSDFIVFLLLGIGKTVILPQVSDKLLTHWASIAAACHCAIGQTLDPSTARQSLRLIQTGSIELGQQNLACNMLHPVLGLFCGRRQPCSFSVDYHLQTPLRRLLSAFAITVTVKSAVEQKKEDPLTRRIRLIASHGSSKKSVTPSFVVSCSFKAQQTEAPCVHLQLPGDDILASLLLTAKSIIPRGQLIIKNMCLEQWSCATLTHLRKMGCIAAIQPDTETAFGEVGMVSIQKFKLSGRKVSCIPLPLFHFQLPSMTVIAQFAAGQTVFRDCEELRLYTPDTIEQYLSFLKQMNVRFGEMPDGFIVDGAREYDGFDMAHSYPAHISAACAVAALRCHGTTTLESSSILQRWPSFFALIDTLCEYRTTQ